MKEAIFLCILGLLAGIGLSFAVELLFKVIFSSLHIDIGLRWMLQAGIIALVSAALGALYPALRAAGQDPIEALAYE